jgi:hypothetical protein
MSSKSKSSALPENIISTSAIEREVVTDMAESIKKILPRLIYSK